MATIPDSAKAHEENYKQAAWEEYTIAELGQWVHLFAMRAGHRANNDKRLKDLQDAQSYLDMMQAKLDSISNRKT
jgi:hypothetical protein